MPSLPGVEAGDLVVVAYEELEWLGRYHWRRIGEHIGASEAEIARWRLPTFGSGGGDRKWIERRRVGDLMRAATTASSSWDESEWRARLDAGPSARPLAEHAAERAERDADRECARRGPAEYSRRFGIEL